MKNIMRLSLYICCFLFFVTTAYAGSGKDKAGIFVYTALDTELSRYSLNVDQATLTKEGSITLPANLQFAVFHPSGRYLYAITSNAGSGTTGAKGDKHLLQVFTVDKEDGSLQAFGEPTVLPERPIHVTVDRDGRYVLVAFNQSGTVKVFKISQNGGIGEEVFQTERPDGGIFTHQVTVTPNNHTVIALGRGNEAVGARPADIGSLSLFAFDQGKLSLIKKTLYEDGIGPRHLAYHPTKPWVYVGMERSSKLFMYNIDKQGAIASEPSFKQDTLLDPANETRERQKGGCIEIHPNGKFIYVANRADGVKKVKDKKVWAGGENNIAVYAVNEKTGEPVLIQHIDTQGIEARTFQIDPSGKLLLVANQKAMTVQDGQTEKVVPANIALFQIQADGTLKFTRKYDITTDSKWLIWLDILNTKEHK